MWTKELVAASIDHAALRPNMTDDDLRRACAVGREFGTATVCVRPSDVRLATAELAGSAVGVSTVIGFPHGANRTAVKALEARAALQEGAVELDMVMNIGRFLSGDLHYVREDIIAVVDEAKRAGGKVKVILEVFYLSDGQIEAACRLAEEAGADFVKTSTGFADGAATPAAVAVMVGAVGGRLGVKASGGIRTWEAATGFLDQGCRRLGLSSTEAILGGESGATGY